jgi:hypothetical protein
MKRAIFLLAFLLGCVDVTPLPVSGGGNFECKWGDTQAFKGTLTINGQGLGVDGESFFLGDWTLCNDDQDIVCTVSVATSTAP